MFEWTVSSNELATFPRVALPDTAAAELGPALVDAGVRVVDLSGTFRRRDESLRTHWDPETRRVPAGVDEVTIVDGKSKNTLTAAIRGGRPERSTRVTERLETVP